MKYIAKDNNVTPETVRNILKNAMSGYLDYIINLSKVISFDEFKTDTIEGKYVFILNDPIHRKALDILPSGKKNT